MQASSLDDKSTIHDKTSTLVDPRDLTFHMIRAPDQAGLHQCLLTVDLEEECGEQESRLFIGGATVLMVTEGSSNYILIRLSCLIQDHMKM